MYVAHVKWTPQSFTYCFVLFFTLKKKLLDFYLIYI